MQQNRVSVFFLAAMLLVFAGPLFAAQAPALSVVPAPVSMGAGDGTYELSSDVIVSTVPELMEAPGALRLLLGPATGYAFPEADTGEQAGIRFQHDASLAPEAYRLLVTEQGITVSAATDAGAFYALQTLRQLLPPQIYAAAPVDARWTVPAVTISDKPRFGWRGLHLDVGRHFMPVEFIKKYIDLLAAHKMNSFHWHLTEDQGWRIEIRRYPKLTGVGARRDETVVGNIMGMGDAELEYDGIPHGGFYTQEEVREVVAYAAIRHVNVVPEIEFPGHAQAAIASYPWLGNSGEQLPVMTRWGINKNTIKPSDETLEFYRNVLKEVMELFPSEFIHIGGDEAPKDQWEQSEFAQQRMQELGLADENELQSWLIGQMDEFLTANGRRLVGWDEIMQGGLSPNATVMSWRGERPGIRAAKAGHDVIMAPTKWTYLDYYQADKKNEPLAIGSYLPLEKVYAYDPAPVRLPKEVRERILGAQGQLWTEYMKTPDHVEYMAYPRAVALAEVVWSPQEQRDYADFQVRLGPHLARLDALGVNYRPPGNDELSFASWWDYWLWNTLISVYFWFQDT